MQAKVTVRKRLEWDAAHRVLRHESKCATLHGHRYAAEVTCSATRLDNLNRVIDFGVIKSVLGVWINENWDHTTICNSEDRELIAFCNIGRLDPTNPRRAPYIIAGEPTAESIALELLLVGTRLLSPHGVRVVGVRVWETPTSMAEATAQ